jgi:hypothetical protein
MARRFSNSAAKFLFVIASQCMLSVEFYGHAHADDLPLATGTVIRFAEPQIARQVLGTRDKFIRAVSRFDVESRLGKLDATSDDLLRFAADQVLPWEASLKEKISPAVAKIRKQLGPFKASFPKEILLVRTTGKEEGGAAYCRGANAIVLPAPVIERRDGQQLQRLLIHELFHILSRNGEKTRRKLYAIVGFKQCPDIPVPAKLRDRKITNPDAPTLEHYIKVEVDGSTVAAVPLLFASIERFDPAKGGSFFRYVTFRLMAVQETEGRWEVVTKDGEPVFIDPKENASFRKQIGGNTGYIIHPDEILADNFVHLLMATKKLSNPLLVEKMRDVLSSHSAKPSRKNR